MVNHYAEAHHLTPPPLATPAILAFLALINRISPFTGGVGYVTPVTLLGSSSDTPQSQEWECEWERCLSLGQGNFNNIHTDSFNPGSIEGVWEGIFTVRSHSVPRFLLYDESVHPSTPSLLRTLLCYRERHHKPYRRA